MMANIYGVVAEHTAPHKDYGYIVPQFLDKEKGSTANTALWDDCFLNQKLYQYIAERQDRHCESFVGQPSGDSLAFLRCRRLISPCMAVTINCPVVSPSSLTDSIASTTSCGARACTFCDLLFMWSLCTTELHYYRWNPVYRKKEIKKGLMWNPVGVYTGFQLSVAALNSSEAPVDCSPPGASNQTVTKDNDMACSHDTQTRPEKTYLWRFIALNRSDLKSVPCRLSVEAATERDARRILAPHFILSLAARLPLQDIEKISTPSTVEKTSMEFSGQLRVNIVNAQNLHNSFEVAQQNPLNLSKTCAAGIRETKLGDSPSLKTLMKASSCTPGAQKEKDNAANVALWDGCFSSHEENQYLAATQDNKVTLGNPVTYETFVGQPSGDSLACLCCRRCNSSRAILTSCFKSSAALVPISSTLARASREESRETSPEASTWRRITSPCIAVTINPALLSPSRLTDSIDSKTSWGTRTVVNCDLAFLLGVAITETPFFGCVSVYMKNEYRKVLTCVSLECKLKHTLILSVYEMAKPAGACDTDGLLTTNDSMSIEVVMLNHTTFAFERTPHGEAYYV